MNARRNAKKLAKDAARASPSAPETQHYTGASTPIIIAPTLNLTPPQSYINLHHHTTRSHTPMSCRLLLKVLEVLALSLTFFHGLWRECIHSCENDGGGEISDGDLDERGYLKVPEYNVGMRLAAQWIAGSLWDSYAYQEHEGDNLGWKPISFMRKREM